MTRRANNHDAIIGKRIRAARLARNLSQSDLADAIGVKFQQIQKYETGMNRISASRLFLAAKILHVDIGHFDLGDEAGSILDDTDALRAAQMVSRLPAHMKDSALLVLTAMSNGVQE